MDRFSPDSDQRNSQSAMEITRYNWHEIEAMMQQEGIGDVTRTITEGRVVYTITIGSRRYDLPAPLARELYSQRRLSEELFEGLVKAGIGTTGGHL